MGVDDERAWQERMQDRMGMLTVLVIVALGVLALVAIGGRALDDAAQQLGRIRQ